MFLGLSLLLSSCFECVEEINLKKDGTGSFVYIVNMSQSKAEINTAFRLDSFMGSKLPSLSQIKTKIASAKNILMASDGISNLTVKENYNDYIIEVRGNFTSIEKFNAAIKKCAKQLGANEEAIESDFSYAGSDTTYHRSVAPIESKAAARILGLFGGKAEQAAYTCIVRTEGKVNKVDNAKAKISPSGKNVLLKVNAAEILRNSAVLNLEIDYRNP